MAQPTNSHPTAAFLAAVLMSGAAMGRGATSALALDLIGGAMVGGLIALALGVAVVLGDL